MQEKKVSQMFTDCADNADVLGLNQTTIGVISVIYLHLRFKIHHNVC